MRESGVRQSSTQVLGRVQTKSWEDSSRALKYYARVLNVGVILHEVGHAVKNIPYNNLAVVLDRTGFTRVTSFLKSGTRYHPVTSVNLV